MQVGSSIILDHFEELEKFSQDFELLGELEFSAPVLDNHGKVLIKENIVFNSSMFARLKKHEGDYREHFDIKLTPVVLRKIRAFLGREIARANHRRIEHDFVDQLLEDKTFSLNDLVTNALQSRRLLLAFFKVYFSAHEFFVHSSRLGVLTLAIVTQLPRAAMIRRHAFLAGLCADLALVDSEAWKYPVISGPAKQSLAESCARFAVNFQLSDDVLDAVANHPVSDTPGSGPAPATAPVGAAPGPDRLLAAGSEMFAEILTITDETEDAEPAAEEPEADGAGVMRLEEDPEESHALLLTEALRIARYVDDIGKRTKDDPAKFAEEAIYLIAYLSGRGFFEAKLSDAVIEVFRKYRVKARRVQKIASIESQCIHPPSAWAYPRPTNAAQIICQHRKMDCPHLVPNWSMHVVSPADAYGWLGAVLDPGEYPKCDLGRDLKKMKDEPPPD